MISAKVIKASRNNYTGTVLWTFELDYPRMIHSEFMTHRMFSRNAQSSRAVPVAKILEANAKFVEPIEWSKNKSGMSATELLDGADEWAARYIWEEAAEYAFDASSKLSRIGLHKQYANRITEPFSRIKVVMTCTELDNFEWLRDDPDAAQPEIVALARAMKAAKESATIVELTNGQWHLPYIKTEVIMGKQLFWDSNNERLHLDDAIKISASCCAQVSYRNLNDSREKAIEIYERLFSGPKPHLSPVEHQAKVVVTGTAGLPDYWPQGVTHMDRKGNFWSGNLKDFVQYRQLISAV